MKKVAIKLKTIEIDALMKYFEPEKVHELCTNCPNYNNNWTCPPHQMDSKEHVFQFSNVLLIMTKIYLNQEITKEKALEQFYRYRHDVGNVLLSLEGHDEEVLYCGQCYQCNVCSKANQEPCRFEKKKRYSVESLGFTVSEILNEVFKEEILWMTDSNVPAYFISLSGIFYQKEIDQEKIKASLNKITP